jgi:fatty acid desaturase
MAEQSLSDEVQFPPTRPAQNLALRILSWATIGAAVGALWAFFHYGTEGWSGPVIVLAISFGLAGAVVALLVSKGCRT